MKEPLLDRDDLSALAMMAATLGLWLLALLGGPLLFCWLANRILP
jgi:hypothetical protein